MTTTTEHENQSDGHADSHGGHQHGGHQKPSYDDVNVPIVFMVGAVSMIVTFLTIWFVEGIYYRWSNELVQERTYDISNTIQAETIAGQKAVLDGNEEKGITSFESVIDVVVGQYDNGGGSPAPNEDDHSNDEPEQGH